MRLIGAGARDGWLNWLDHGKREISLVIWNPRGSFRRVRFRSAATTINQNNWGPCDNNKAPGMEPSDNFRA